MRRRRKPEESPAEPEQPPTGRPEVEGPRAHGPFDVTEHPVGEGDAGRAHLGSLSVPGVAGAELRLQVDESSGQVASVLLVAPDGAMEVRAFAAARHDDNWGEVRASLVAEAQRRGGSAQEIDGPYGPAVHLVVPAAAPDGTQVSQPSTVLGISGPRWLLRVSCFGRPSREWRADAPLETALRNIVVLRGSQPMAPGDPLPLSLPARAQRLPGPSDRPPSSAGQPPADARDAQ